jgi:hypothetical protein
MSSSCSTLCILCSLRSLINLYVEQELLYVEAEEMLHVELVVDTYFNV